MVLLFVNQFIFFSNQSCYALITWQYDSIILEYFFKISYK